MSRVPPIRRARLTGQAQITRQRRQRSLAAEEGSALLSGAHRTKQLVAVPGHVTPPALTARRVLLLALLLHQLLRLLLVLVFMLMGSQLQRNRLSPSSRRSG